MADRKRLIETLIDLVRIDSPSGEEDAIDQEVSARLSALGLTVEHDSYNNIIARLEGAGEPLLLSAHLDTVEPGRGIKPELDGDTLRSDGTTILGGDCKAGAGHRAGGAGLCCRVQRTTPRGGGGVQPPRGRRAGWRAPHGLQPADC